MSEDRFGVMLEVTPYDLTEVANVSGPDIVPIGKFKLDLIVFEGKVQVDRPGVRAVVELKRSENTEKLVGDIKRISHVLSVMAVAENEVEPIGIQLLYTVHDKESAAKGSRAALESAIKSSRVRCSEPWPVDGEPYRFQDKDLWYTATATTIRRACQR
jgi:hypothetical protein